ncbi:hypothetical protein FACS189429_2130 [Bacteroidia bacterium]|nr:hypothetical protein FACS189429_2130 [Bacteroidia bacterium]
MKLNNLIILALLAITAGSCHQATKKTADAVVEAASSTSEEEDNAVLPEEDSIPQEIAEKFAKFLPEGYRLFDIISGDLNKDGKEDTVLIVKATDRENFVVDEYQEYRGVLDRNRRGLIILLSNNERFTNLDCFSSENENGGVYYAPELWIYINKGNLYIDYGHGRYGYWCYVFRYKNYGNYFDFELIGYDASDNRGPVVESATSINFLTKRRQTRVNTNADAEGGDEIFKETWENIDYNANDLILSKITDFDRFNIRDCYRILDK